MNACYKIIFCTLFLCIQLPNALATELDWQSYERFRNLCNRNNITILENIIDTNNIHDYQGIIVSNSKQALPTALLSDLVSKGMNLLIFDDHDHTYAFLKKVAWNLSPNFEWKEQSPYPSINANPYLPIASPMPDPRFDGIQFLAFNHPLPATSTHPNPLVGNKSVGFFFENTWGKGKIYFITDSSLPMNIMMKTLDNEKFIQVLLLETCQKAAPCKLLWLHEEFTQREVKTTRDIIKEKFDEKKANLQTWWKQNKEAIYKIPWYKITISIALFWFLSLSLILLPLKHK